MQYVVKLSTVYRCSLERAFKTPMLCDVSKVHTGFLVMPRVMHCTEDGDWGRVGSRKRVFVALGPANRVAVIDGETDEVLDYLLVGQRVWQLGFTPDQKYLFTTNGNSNDVSVIDVAAMKVVKSIPVGQQPWGVVVAPN